VNTDDRPRLDLKSGMLCVTTVACTWEARSVDGRKFYIRDNEPMVYVGFDDSTDDHIFYHACGLFYWWDRTVHECVSVLG
jgi:hypothetical protein